MLLFDGLAGIITIGLMVYCLFDLISTDSSAVQNLPKMVWLLLIIFLPLIGGVAWLLLGRPSGARLKLGGTEHRALPPTPPIRGFSETPMSGDDYQKRREETLRRYEEDREAKLREREEELAKREEELRRREEGLS